MKELLRCYGPCKKTLPIDDFSRAKSSRGGRNRRCRECDAIHSAKRDVYTPKRAAYLKAYSKKYLADPANAQKVMARILCRKALKSGTLIRATSCQVCGSDRNIEAHHPDYSKPLDVRWLCKRCHRKEDEKLLNH